MIHWLIIILFAIPVIIVLLAPAMPDGRSQEERDQDYLYL